MLTAIHSIALQSPRRRVGRSLVIVSAALLACGLAGRGDAASGPQGLPMSKAVKHTAKPAGPNPMLAFLPVGAQPDYDAWRNWMALQGQQKRAAQPAVDLTKLISLGEAEPNNQPVTANSVGGFGTGPGDDPAADLSGDIAASTPTVIGPFAEDDGSITLASATGVISGASVKINHQLGDGPHGDGASGSGDFDFFSISGVAAGDVITVDIDAVVNGSPLDPFIVLWDSAGTLLAYNDDFNTLDSFMRYTAPVAGTYYLSVGAYLCPAPSNPFDSSSGPGATSEGPYSVTIGLNSEDLDYFSIDLEAGDVIAANVTGTANELRLYDPTTVQRIGSTQDASSIVPGPFPAGGNATFAYVVESSGSYLVRVSGNPGTYGLELRAFRPHLEGQPAGAVQTLFLDFNGASVDPSIFGGPPGPVNLSPLSAFLTGWGLTPADENAVIDAIVAAVVENLSTDMRVLGANGDFDVTGIPGDFDVVVLNSRDHADPFGNPNVSRVIVGGTIPELTIGTIGIAQSIDVGNFAPSETAVVLLDLLSGPSFDPNSLNQFALGGGKTIVDLVGIGVGNIVAHEAGHFFANFHTDNFDLSPSIMDQGGDLANTVGVGPDLTLGTIDDVDVDFGDEPYVPNEGFTGLENTLDAVAFGLSTSLSVAVPCGNGVLDIGEDCDDGNTLNGDCCSATCTKPICTATGFGKAMLQAKESVPGHERLTAKFLKGPLLVQADFGDPAGGTTAYHLCVWRDGTALVGDYLIDRAGQQCGTKDCWKSIGAAPPNGKGYAFKDLSAASDGVKLVSLKAGGAGKSKALVKGAGGLLPPLAPALQTATSVTMQIVGDDAPSCLEASLTSISRQDALSFKAK